MKDYFFVFNFDIIVLQNFDDNNVLTSMQIISAQKNIMCYVFFVYAIYGIVFRKTKSSQV